MRTLTNNPAPASKDNLARLMAGENLRVEHDPQAPTASFDLKNRVLTLPVWKNLPEDTIDMLIGHEVSHALHTPPGDALEKACRRIAPNNPTRAQVYINVVEDARIERLIKRDYPGLRRSFVGGYDELLSRDLFKIKGKNIAELGFLDRINLQYKIGHRLAVPFSAEELPLVQRVATAVSWDDVVALSKDIYDFCREQKRKERENNKPQDSKDSKSLPSDEQGEDQSDSEQDAEGQSDDESDSEPNGEDTGDSDADSNGKADENDQEESGQAPEGEEGQGDVQAQSGGETDRDPTDETGGSGNGRGGDSEEFDDTPDDAETVNAAKQELDKFADRTGAPTVYADLPKPTDRCVVPVKVALASFRANYRDLVKYYGNSTTVATLQASPAVCYNSWKKHHADAVQVLATEFDRRKAADEHKRTMVAETGVIDPNRLHAYRITDDIFLRNSLVRDGKNHGVVLLLDMSGSIHESFHNLVIQLVTLAHFCRRVNIPFRFYGFTDRAKGDTSLDCKAGERYDTFTTNDAFPGSHVGTRLVTLLEDGMKTQEFVEQCGYLLHCSYTITYGGRPAYNVPTFEDLKAACGHNNVPSFSVPNWFNLDQTPLNAALLAMVTLAPKFKAEKRVQVANLIVLTDGEASDSMTHINGNSQAWSRVRQRQIGATGYGGRTPLIVWRDTVTRKQWNAFHTGYNGNTYCIDRGQETRLLVSIIRSYGINTVFMYAAATKRIAKVHIGEAIVGTTNTDEKRVALRGSLEASLKDNGWFSVPECHGFTDYIVFTVATAKNENTLGAVDASTASGLRSLRSQFIKNQSGRRANRPLLARVAEVLSK